MIDSEVWTYKRENLTKISQVYVNNLYIVVGQSV